MKLKQGCTFQVRTVTLPRGGALQSWRQMGCEHEAGSRVWGSSVCRWAEAGLQWVLEEVVQTWALQLVWVQDLHVLLPHGEMPRLRFH